MTLLRVLALLLVVSVTAVGQVDFTPTSNKVSIGARNLTFQGSGGTPPYTFSFQGPPIPGFQFFNQPNNPGSSTASSLIGVAATAGVFVANVRAQDSLGNFTVKPYTLTVIDSPLMLGGQNPQGLGVGDSVTWQFTSMGAAPTFTVNSGSLPPGLTLNPVGIVSGILTTAGTYNFSLRVTSAGETEDISFSFFVSPMRLSNVAVNTRLLPAATQNTPYSFTVVPAGGESALYLFVGGPAQRHDHRGEYRDHRLDARILPDELPYRCSRREQQHAPRSR